MVFAAINNVSANSQLSTAANKLASDIRYAQSMAVGSTLWYGVTFEVNPANRYRLYTTTGTADTAADDPSKFGSNFIVYVATSFAVTINSATVETRRAVEFSPLGTPYSDKNQALGISTEGVVTLKKGTQTKTVRITPNTGRVYVQ
jgi:Tfp pilus assembly protein FimT